MAEEHLRSTLADLHRELEETDAVAPETRRLLEQVLEDIGAILRCPVEERPPQHESESLADRLRDLTGDLEEAHPHLTSAIRQVADAIGRTIA